MRLAHSILGGIVGIGLAVSAACADPLVRPFSREDAISARVLAAQVRLAGLTPESRPAHMIRYPVVVETRTPEVRPVARDPFLPTARWDHRSDAEIWTRAAMSAVEGHGAPLFQRVPDDIGAWCPGYATRGPEARQAFWVGLFSALAKHESTWRPEAVGGGGQWYGLLQILPSTARLYSCRATTGQALKNPIENLSCSVRIAARQVERRGSVSRGMRDWGPFHSAAKRAEMAAWTSRQSYCQPKTLVRPEPRPATGPWAVRISTMGVASRE